MWSTTMAVWNPAQTCILSCACHRLTAHRIGEQVMDPFLRIAVRHKRLGAYAVGL